MRPIKLMRLYLLCGVGSTIGGELTRLILFHGLAELSVRWADSRDQTKSRNVRNESMQQ